MVTSNVGSIDVSGTLGCLKPWEGMCKCLHTFVLL